jgi:hypothetical protein
LLAGRWVGRLEGWKAGRLEGWKAGRLEGWQAGMLEGWQSDKQADTRTDSFDVLLLGSLVKLLDLYKYK